MRHTNFYDLLQVQPDASVEVIRAAYRAMAKVCHPDVGGDADVMKQLNEALETLTDPARREAYDRRCLARNRQRDDSEVESSRSRGTAPSRPTKGTVTNVSPWRNGAVIILVSIVLVVALALTMWTQSGPSNKAMVFLPETGSASEGRSTDAAPGTPTDTTQRTTASMAIEPTVSSGTNELPGGIASGLKTPEGTFTLGSPQDQVQAVMGPPSTLIGSYWRYGLSGVEFGPQGTVIGWSNIGGNLKVYLGDRQDGAPQITLGSTKEEVLAVMGTPTSIIGDEWGFGLSHVDFDHRGIVIGWSDIQGNLRASLGERKSDAPGIGVGSTKAEVVAAMGTPSSIIGNLWGYGLSGVDFGPQGTVTGWNNIAGNIKLR